MDDTKPTNEKIASFAADIVAAHVANNQMNPNDVPGLFTSVAISIAQFMSGAAPAAAAAAASKQEPVVPIKKSVTPDAIICLEDGRRFKSLKRHLATKYGMTPDDYRAKWGLAKDYPMVAPSYAAQRSALAKSMGLGQGGRGAAPAPSIRGSVKTRKTPANA